MANKYSNFEEQAKAVSVQRHMINGGAAQLGNIEKTIQVVNEDINSNLIFLDTLLDEARNIPDNPTSFIVIEDEDDMFLVDAEEYTPIVEKFEKLDYLDTTVVYEENWNDYFSKIERYADNHSISFGESPFYNLMTSTEVSQFQTWVKEDFTYKNANCDKYDYMIAGTCGIIGGIIDVFLVANPSTGYLTKFTDKATNQAVEKFAKFAGWKGPKDGRDSLKSAIGFLERNFGINYDHQHTKSVDGAFKMSTQNHHIKSVGHSPDIVGLFFSILNQFTGTASFYDKGQIITIDSEFNLQGSNVVSKIFAGFFNWLGHLFSDVAGSSGAVGRGSGIPIPFYPLLQFLDFGRLGPDKQTIATIAVRVFQQGYDFRHGVAMAVPVTVTELLTRLMWSIKQRYFHLKDWTDCLPKSSIPELRRMLLVSHGSLCLIDIGDAALRSGGNIFAFFLRANFIAWIRFSKIAMQEIPSMLKVGSLNNDEVNSYLELEYKRLLTTI